MSGSDESRSAAASDRALPILGQKGTSAPGLDASPSPDSLLPMDRRQALKVMAIAAAAPGLASCAPDADVVDPSALPNPTDRRAGGR